MVDADATEKQPRRRARFKVEGLLAKSDDFSQLGKVKHPDFHRGSLRAMPWSPLARFSAPSWLYSAALRRM